MKLFSQKIIIVVEKQISNGICLEALTAEILVLCEYVKAGCLIKLWHHVLSLYKQAMVC